MRLKVLEDLLVIQDRDRRASQLRLELSQIPERKAQAEARLAARREAVHQAEADTQHHASAIKQLELEVEGYKEKITRFRQQQFEVKTNLEYKTLEHEIASHQQKIRGAEDRELDLMEQAEAIRTRLAARRKELEDSEAEVRRECADLDARADNVARELAAQDEERTRLVAAADPEWFPRYDRILKHKGDYAIVPVENGACGGCHMKLPPQLVHDAKKAQAVTACTFCGRMLYWKD